MNRQICILFTVLQNEVRYDLYAEMYPHRVRPHHTIFRRFHQRLRETGSLRKEISILEDLEKFDHGSWRKQGSAN